MSYSGRKRYKSRREKVEKTWKDFKLVILFGALAAVLLLFKNWTDIIDYLGTYFY